MFFSAEFWSAWSFPPIASIALLLTALIYFSGWRLLRRLLPRHYPNWRLAAFMAGLASIWIAIASPLDAFDDVLLTAHMMQHLLFMVIAPPLLLLAAPAIPLLRGVPRPILRRAIAPWLRMPMVQRIGRALTHPIFCWLAMAVAMLAWHVPAAYEWALKSAAWHEVEHACFLITSTLFWFPVIQPWPSRSHWPRWAMPLYLLFGDIVNTVLSAFLAFSDRVLYPSYANSQNGFGISAIGDQAAAGAVMWAVGSFVFLGAAAVLMLRLLSDESASSETRWRSADQTIEPTIASVEALKNLS